MHELQHCYKKHYLINCVGCHALFHVTKKELKFKKVKKSDGSKTWISKNAIQCPGCRLEQRVSGYRWYWIPSRKYKGPCSLDDRIILCDFGRIVNMQLYAPTKNYLSLSSSTTGHIRGTFLSEESHFRIDLEKYCERIESTYILRPFRITIISKNLITHHMADVCLTESKPWVYLSEQDNYALLSRSCDFTAKLIYSDPLYGSYWK